MSSPSLSVADALQLAVNAHRTGNLQQAEHLYKAILAAHPGHPDAAHNLGVLAMGLDRLDEALGLFETALNAAPQIPQYWKSAIHALYELGGTEKAREISERYLGLNPTDAEALSEHARILLMLPATSGANADAIPESAQTAMAQALALCPDSPVVLRNHARLLLKTKNTEGALQAIRQAHALQPRHHETCLVLASALLAAEQPEAARAMTDEALRLRPTYAEGLGLRGLLALRDNRLEQAEADLREALRLRPHLVQIRQFLTALLLRQNRRPEAIEATERYLHIRPTDIQALTSIAELFRQEMRFEEAHIALNRALSLDNNNETALVNLATLLQAQKRHTEALSVYHRITQTNPDNLTVLHNVASILSEQWRLNEAAEVYERLLKAHPDHINALLNYANTLLRLYRPKDAGDVLQRLADNRTLCAQMTAGQQEFFLGLQREHMGATWAADPAASLQRPDMTAPPSADGQPAPQKPQFIPLTEYMKNLVTPVPEAEQGTCPMTALVIHGRSATLFFHSLFDGHPDILTLPGVYFKGWFGKENIKRFTVNPEEPRWRELLVHRFMDTYEPLFDPLSTKDVPGSPFGSSTGLGKGSGLTTMGPEADTLLTVDTGSFRAALLALLADLPTVTPARFFELIHQAYYTATGRSVSGKHIFYHIHNPSEDEMASFLRMYPKAKVIQLVRHPLQSLESWMLAFLDAFNTPADPATDPVAADSGMRRSVLEAGWMAAATKLECMLFDSASAFAPVSRCTAVRIEDVKRSPRETMPAVARWMGIAPHEALYESTFNGIQYWGPTPKATHAISGFDTAAIDKPLGRLFGERDLYMLEVLFHPFMRTHGYSDMDVETHRAALKTIEPWLDEPLEFEQRLYAALPEPKASLEEIPAYRAFHHAMRREWTMMQNTINKDDFLFQPLL